MTWLQIRAHFKRVMKERQLNQTQIARRGGWSNNSAISKLLVNDNLGPEVQTFARAVDGLGMSLSEFFVSLEQEFVPPQTSTTQRPSAIDQKALELSRAIQLAIQRGPRRRT